MSVAILSRRDLFLILMVVIFWGAHATVIKFALQEIEPLFLASLRYLLTSLVFMHFIRRIDMKSVPILLLVGCLFLGLNMGGAQMALDRIPANSFILIAMAGIPVLIIADWLINGKQFGIYTAIGVCIAFAGLLVIYGAPDIMSAPLGFLFGCIAVLGWVIGSMMMRKTGHIDIGFFNTISGISGFISMFALSLLVEDNHIQQLMEADWTVVSLALFYQVGILSIVTYVWGRLMSRNPAEVVSPFLLLQVPWGISIAVIFLGETLSWQTWVGGAMVVGGVGLVQWRRYVHYRRTAQ